MFNKQQKRFTLSSSKGFTLIELLVVIAIIGLLAGIVLVSLGGARDSAKDARITSALSQSRSLAELVANSNNGSYMVTPADPLFDLCAAATLSETHTIYGGDLGAVETDVLAQGGSDVTCEVGVAEFCIYATLNNGQFYCIDSTASSVQTPTDPAGVGFCDVTPFTCPS